MARGPFQGNYQPNFRPTVVHSPDAIVYINGEADLVGCPVCKKKFDLSKYITSVTVDLSVDSSPGSASVSLSIPRHIVDDFFFDGEPIISEMMEIEIYAKGYYLVEGLPQYYPIFWGLTTEISDNYSGGEHTVTIQCNDILKWWELSKMNINPAFTGESGQMGRSLFGNVFFGMNPYDVIFTLANQAFGDVVVGTGSLTSLVKEAGQKGVFTSALTDIMSYWQDRFSRIRSNLLLYGVNGAAVRGDSLYNAYNNNKASLGKPIASSAIRAGSKQSGEQPVFDPASANVVAFRTQVMNAGQINFFQSEYQTKLELANSAKEAIGFEFYMDVTGDIVFKPPFYNLDVLANKPVSWIQDIDIIDWNFSASEAEVVTQLTIQGNFTGNADYGLNTEELTPYTSVTDYHLLRKYGWRSHTFNSEFMGDTQLMFYHGLDVLDRINSKRHHATITIPMRPELRLGFPIYIAPKDQMWYISGISHNIAFGSRATTTLTLTARRGKFKAPKGHGTLTLVNKGTPPATKKGSPTTSEAAPTTPSTSKAPDKLTTQQLAQATWDLEVGGAAAIPGLDYDPSNPATTTANEPLILRHPKTGRICGYPNMVMVYSQPMANASLDQIKRATGTSKDGQASAVAKKFSSSVAQKEAKQVGEFFTKLQDTKVEDATKKYNSNRYRYGLTSAGVFIYAYESKQQVTQFALLPEKNITVKTLGVAQDAKTLAAKRGSALIRPVSDERGFEVIGHYRYGRGISLRDGRLVQNADPKTIEQADPKDPKSKIKVPVTGNNLPAAVDVQLALSGGLFETLTAQSQGLTTISTAYDDPADAVARLAPDGSDLQSAAIVDNTTKEASYVNTEPNFMDTAPLGSPQDEGALSSVEASQLSHALTLAEMSVIGDLGVSDDDCMCVTGRADLAFINVGYSIKTVNPAQPTSDIFGSAAAGGAPVDSAALETGVPVPPGTVIGSVGSSLSGSKPGSLKFDNMQDAVNKYLTTLYEALDGPHQMYEKALRGELTEFSQSETSASSPGTGQTFGDLTPPFSSMDRTALGDPTATAQQGQSAMSNLQQKFKNFGQTLSNQANAVGIQNQILALQQQLVGLNSQLKDNPSDPILQQKVSDAQRQLQNLQLQLAQAKAGH